MIIMSETTQNPFKSLLVSPSELHSALSNATSSPRRIVPVAAGRESGLKSYESKRIPGSVYEHPLHNPDINCLEISS
jgi:thiosulfate/3-mercaptopyruvate sulfurtransferase